MLLLLLVFKHLAEERLGLTLALNGGERVLWRRFCDEFPLIVILIAVHALLAALIILLILLLALHLACLSSSRDCHQA